ncbi:MAG: type 1 glutamine amidotransferase [Pseudomonadota bacterium]
MDRIRLGILQTNHDKSVAVGDAFPDDAHRFRDLFDTLPTRYRYRIYMTIGGEVPSDLGDQDAYLITGSPLSVMDDLDFKPALFDFIRRADAAGKPLIGCCFGHQAIAAALGGTLEKRGWNVGIETAQITQRHAWMNGDEPLPLYVYHQDQVTELPMGAQLYKSSNACPIAGFTKGTHIMTTQAHPEITDAFMRCVLGAEREEFDENQWATIQSSLKQDQQGAIFATWMDRFIQGHLA